MENYELGCYGFDDVIMGGLDLMRACRDGSSLVIDGDLQAVFVVEDVECSHAKSVVATPSITIATAEMEVMVNYVTCATGVSELVDLKLRQ